MKRSGSADLALMGGSIPSWLFERMTKLSLPVVESIILNYGRKAFLQKLSDPFWFQSFGAVIGMDWNSSGVTTAVMSALKKSINPHSKELGICVCGGKGKDSLQTPNELMRVGDATGISGTDMARASRLTAKVDSTAIQDGFQVYMHYFVVSSEADWSVVQQGMHTESSKARRYHWNSSALSSFVEEPHTGICGDHQGDILNLVDKQAKPAQGAMLSIAKEHPEKMLEEIRHLTMPTYSDIKAKDVELKRLGSILWLAQEAQTQNFEELLLLKGLGPRTLQSLALVSEVIHGTSARFSDPARFSFAHGGKGGRPFPVPTQVYDETIETLKHAVAQEKIGDSDKHTGIEKLTQMAQKAEDSFTPNDKFEALVQKEKDDAWKYGGRTIDGFSKKK
jgi:uncharacterized protein